ncbi:hypothetical protein [Capnocytophaga sp. oral taxon 380]|uniref:hypothetical protein n=1 Tax=Capnocytophaga sp. oral taxon 380 TaxID=712217 RepID=UPI0002A4276F|nr:hypothetical protein [Capnocytophaga sp. oral taxon 380]EKY10400.1 hypothetical protein HMPREF9078_00103 [Capnocytophaga sp. oral taxon 380 str. F0488]DAY06917.1 MAG TPA: Protein of unknown function (DUF1018) [Caudoviricetes sp.]
MATAIKAHQIRILQTLLSKRFRYREARLNFVCSFIGRELPSTKNLTEDEFFALAEHLGYKFEMYAYFDTQNKQHLKLLSLCHELGWRDTSNPKYADIKRLGKWFCSSKNPFKKSLQNLTPSEVGKVNNIFEKMLTQRYERS